jgi:tripartite-type tricarboxylate transporter receptor subunit TctC
LSNDLAKTDIPYVAHKGIAAVITYLSGGHPDAPTTAEAGAPQLPVESRTAVMAPVRPRAGLRRRCTSPAAFGKFLPR